MTQILADYDFMVNEINESFNIFRRKLSQLTTSTSDLLEQRDDTMSPDPKDLEYEPPHKRFKRIVHKALVHAPADRGPSKEEMRNQTSTGRDMREPDLNVSVHVSGDREPVKEKIQEQASTDRGIRELDLQVPQSTPASPNNERLPEPPSNISTRESISHTYALTSKERNVTKARIENVRDTIAEPTTLSSTNGGQHSISPSNALNQRIMSPSDEIKECEEFLKQHWSLENTMFRILRCVEKDIPRITVDTVLQRGPVVESHRFRTALRCFYSIHKLHYHNFIKVKAVGKEIVDINLGKVITQEPDVQ